MREIIRREGYMVPTDLVKDRLVAIATAVLRVVKKWDNQLYWIPSIFID